MSNFSGSLHNSWDYLTVYVYDKDNFTESQLTTVYAGYNGGKAKVGDLTNYIRPGKSYYLKVAGTAGEEYSMYLSTPPYGSTNGYRGSAQQMPYNADVDGTLDESTGASWYWFTAPSAADSIVELTFSHQYVYDSKNLYLYEADKFTSNNLASMYIGYTERSTLDISKFIKPGKKYYLYVSGPVGESFNLFLSGPGDSKVLTKVALSQASQLDMPIGQTVSLKATAYYSDNTQQDITTAASWTSSNSKVATVNGGKVTALADGTTTITASYNGQSASTVVNVSSTGEPATLKTMIVSPKKVALEVGGETTVTVTGVYDDGSRKEVTAEADWASEDEDVAIAVKGTIIATGEGQTVVTADLEGITATIPVTVTGEAGEVVLESLSASEETIVLQPNKSLKLSVYALYSDGEEKDITKDKNMKVRISPSSSLATFKSGIVKAGKKTGTGTIIITYEKKTLEIPIEVSNNKLKELEISDTEMTLDVGEKKQVDLTAVFENGSTKDVTSLAKWSTDDSEVAVANNGEIEGIGPGIAVITARYADKVVEITVEVSGEAGELEGIEVSESNLKLVKGDESELSVYATYTNGKQKEITDDEGLVWKSRNKSVASVTPDGVIRANAVGNTTVTVSYEGFEASIKVEVTAAKTVKKLVIDPTSLSMNVNDEEVVTLTAQYTDGSEEDVTEKAVWSAKLTKVATVKKGVVTAVGAGTTTITAKFGGKTAIVNVTVR